VIHVKQARKLKGLNTSIVVTGCMVNLDKEAVLARHPDIDHLVMCYHPCDVFSTDISLSLIHAQLVYGVLTRLEQQALAKYCKCWKGKSAHIPYLLRLVM
jgi:tRNA A37 methylthiotransferase MiaB